MAGKKQYTPKQLLAMLVEARRRLGKSPSTKDLRRLGYPKADTFKTYFPSVVHWNDILNLAKLDPLSDRYTRPWNKKEVSEWIKRFRDEVGKLPTRRDLGKVGSPSDYSIKKHFGSWTNALVSVLGTAHRKQYSKNECIKYLKTLRRYHTYDELKLLAKEFGNPHPDTIIRLTGKKLPALQESLGMGIKFGIFGAYPVFWEQLCEQIAVALYGKIQRQHSLQIDGIKRRLDIYVPRRGLVIEAMTSSYETTFKKKSLKAYAKKSRTVECWCVVEGKEISIERVHYVYLDELLKRVRDSKVNAVEKSRLLQQLGVFKNKPDHFLERLGRATRKQLIFALRKRAQELGRVPQQLDMRVEDGYSSYQIYARTFGGWRRALKAAGF